MTAKHYIREWRKHRGMTLAKLEERTGISVGALSRLEHGGIRWNEDQLRKIGDALGVAPSDLLAQEPSDPIIAADLLKRD